MQLGETKANKTGGSGRLWTKFSDRTKDLNLAERLREVRLMVREIGGSQKCHHHHHHYQPGFSLPRCVVAGKKRSSKSWRCLAPSSRIKWAWPGSLHIGGGSSLIQSSILGRATKNGSLPGHIRNSSKNGKGPFLYCSPHWSSGFSIAFRDLQRLLTSMSLQIP